MNDNFTTTTLLIRYMDNELAVEEQSSLEATLNNDEALKQELDNLKFTRLCVNGLGLRKQVGAVHAEMMEEFKQTNKPIGILRSITRVSMQVAAGLLVLILAGGVYQYLTISPEKLMNENYKSYTIGTSRSTNDINPIEKVFTEKKYQEVISIVKNTPDPQPKDYFLAGNAYLETNDIANAIVSFNKCIDKNIAFQTTNYLEDAEYFLAISYLKNKEPKKALPLFQKINHQPLHLYHDKVSTWFIQKVKVAAWKA